MPPSAGACQTIDALLKPDCGLAPRWSSIMIAIGWRIAASGVTSRPVIGAGTRTIPGVASGVGLAPGAVADGGGAVTTAKAEALGPVLAVGVAAVGARSGAA